MTKHILVAGKLHPSALRVLDSAEGVSFDYVPDADPTAYLPLLPKAQ
ncbi:MAG: 3-phosphoglycerate dehydrogenase, partial [Rhodobacteraceae bacterium]|nr:3-phosphoglycerate dehydrogenase [Paracoccaceae bacterium]